MFSGNASVLADPKMWLIVLFLSVVDTAAALVPYYAGRGGTEIVLARFPQVREERLDRVQQLYEEYGSGLLFFSCLPVLGVLLSAGDGVAGTRLPVFILWVLVGKATRWGIVLLLVNQTLQVLS